jgi:hypothetical protein
MCPRIQMTALCLGLGHAENVGRVNHMSRICRSSVRKIKCSCLCVHFQISATALEDISLCFVVSLEAHSEHTSVGLISILWSLSFVSVTSCMTVYHVELTSSGRKARAKFLLTEFQSEVDYRSWMRSLTGGHQLSTGVGRVQHGQFHRLWTDSPA